MSQLNQLLILGGGRWARVIVGVLCDLTPPNTKLIMCSPRGADSLNNWISEKGLGERILVTSQRPESLNSSRSAVFVANSARDHVSAGLWAMERGAAVLIEKPLALSLPDARSLVNYAERRGRILCAAHVLRFARYFENFSSIIPPWCKITSISFEWIDPVGEIRYGELKKHDATVPVFMDTLPHVVSVLKTVFGILPELHSIDAIGVGGSVATITLLMGKRTCCVTMRRDGKRRVRRLSVLAQHEKVVLDFSQEPGTFRFGDAMVVGDNLWNTKPRPLASMLTAFLSAAQGMEVDPRLGLDVAIASCGIVDCIMENYRD